MAGCAQRATSDTRAEEPGSASSAAADVPSAISGRERVTPALQQAVISRLLLAHPGASPPLSLAQTPDCLPPCTGDVAAFAGLVLATDVEPILARVRALHERGLSLEALYLHLLAPAARHLDALWRDERVDFVDVTIALCRLQQVLRDLAPEFLGEHDQTRADRSALVVPVPGEQHAFGAQMVAQFFRGAGWHVCSEPAADKAQLVELVRRQSFDLVGLSVGHDVSTAELRALVAALRRASRNRRLCILVGGAVFVAHAHSALEVGADGEAGDAAQAVQHAEAFFGSRT